MDDMAVIELLTKLVEKLGMPVAIGIFGWYQFWQERRNGAAALKEKDTAFAAMQTRLLDEQRLLQQKLMDLALEQVKVNLRSEAALDSLRDTLRKWEQPRSQAGG